MRLNLETDKMIAEKEGGIGWITFNNPARRNATTFDMWQAIPKILDDYGRDRNVRVVVLRGAGDKAFVSGADISEFAERRNTPEQVETYNANTERAHKAFHDFEKPILGMIQGFCIGGGLAVALDTDIRIASDDSKFGVPAAKLGLGYAFEGIRHLMQLVGPAYAQEIFFTARQFTAAEALRMGLVNKVVPAAELEATVRDYAATIAGNAPLTVKAAKAAVREGMATEGKRDLDRVARMVKECFESGDYIEGRTAFMEKRPPNFKGR
ncbi:MAG: enoyl-CoA hydratase [Alphaproteobacteria bacterium]|nr:enoyl-CoA hydratase [Alphaproteobacteria bacterium]